MEEFLTSWLNEDTNVAVLLLVIASALALLGKAADWAVHAAVALSVRTGLPKVVIGVTVVSLGTTAPEVAISVMAAIGGNPGLALGNAVGSIICDTGLILGIAATLRLLPLDPSIVRRQSWIQLAAGVLLVLACWPLHDLLGIFESGGNLPRLVGGVFLGLLGLYLWLSVKWARQQRDTSIVAEECDGADSGANWQVALVKLVASLALVILASKILIPAVEVLAKMFGIPDPVIAATLVAFGTSLPELVTAVTATLRGHGELAVGNVIGADILNVLLVAGASAAVSSGGLHVPPSFFAFQFPVMLTALVVLRVGIRRGKTALRRLTGIALLTIYAVYLLLNAVIFF